MITKKFSYLFPLLLSLAFIHCKEKSTHSNEEKSIKEQKFFNENANTLIERYKVPNGFERVSYNKNDFGYFLQHLPLKTFGSQVAYFDGSVKNKANVYNGVIDLPIGQKDLHQCADATMRMRADYLYQQKRYNEIAFNFISDGQPRFYTEYIKGDYSKEKYWKYLEYIFSYANTASLKAQLKTIPYTNVKIGDILIQQGNPYGHAVMVVDLVTNGKDKMVLLAQSYMPAQEMQILDNPTSIDDSPWYKLEDGKIKTPEWNFTSEDWKTWE